MSPPHIEVRLAVCVCNVAAIISGFGICTPVRSVREKWKVLEKRNSGRDEKALNSLIFNAYCGENDKAPRVYLGALNPFLLLRGENRIRTCEPVLPVTRFPGVPLQPLEHLSLFAAAKLRISKQNTK